MTSKTTLQSIFKNVLPREIINKIYYESVKIKPELLNEIRRYGKYYKRLRSGKSEPYILQRREKYTEIKYDMILWYDLYVYENKYYVSQLNSDGVYECKEAGDHNRKNVMYIHYGAFPISGNI